MVDHWTPQYNPMVIAGLTERTAVKTPMATVSGPTTVAQPAVVVKLRHWTISSHTLLLRELLTRLIASQVRIILIHFYRIEWKVHYSTLLCRRKLVRRTKLQNICFEVPNIVSSWYLNLKMYLLYFCHLGNWTGLNWRWEVARITGNWYNKQSFITFSLQCHEWL